jgi:hypothetical protein
MRNKVRGTVGQQGLRVEQELIQHFRGFSVISSSAQAKHLNNAVRA